MQKPYIAFVGNLAFETTEPDLVELFSAASVRIVRDAAMVPKGFAYVEFSDAAPLRAALARDGETVAGRRMRVSLAEPPKRDESDRRVTDEKLAGSWRSAKPTTTWDPAEQKINARTTQRGEYERKGDRGDWRCKGKVF